MRRFHRLIPLLGLLLAAPALLPAGAGAPVYAAPDASSILRALDDDGGWSYQSTRDGIKVYSKEIPAIGLTAFKGVGLFEVDGDRLFTLISDLPAHKQVTGTLHESVAISTRGGVTDYYQVMKSPGPLLSARYWFNRSTNTRDINGQVGHHRRSWSSLDETLYPEQRKEVAERYPDAVAITLTHGSWEVVPESPGRCTLTYRAVSHPGGSVPTSVAAMASSQNLPDNMMAFVRAVGGKVVSP